MLRKEWERERNDRMILEKCVWRWEREIKDLQVELDSQKGSEG